MSLTLEVCDVLDVRLSLTLRKNQTVYVSVLVISLNGKLFYNRIKEALNKFIL